MSGGGAARVLLVAAVMALPPLPPAGAGHESAKQLRTRWSASFLYRISADLLLDAECRYVFDKQVPRHVSTAVGRSLETAVATLERQQAAHLANIRHRFPEARPLPKGTRVTLVDDEEVRIDTGPDDDIEVTTGSVRSILEAVAHGVVLRARPNASEADPLIRYGRNTSEILEGLCRLIQSGSISDFEALETSRLRTPAMDNAGVLTTYSSAVLFALSHELGHVALRHIDRDFFRSCEKRQRLELEADRYGSYLLYSMIAGREQQLRPHGYSIFFPPYSDYFFNLVYTAIGFAHEDSAGCYPYPDTGMRIAGSDEAREWARMDAASAGALSPRAAALFVRDSTAQATSLLWDRNRHPYDLRIVVRAGIEL